MSVGVWGGEAGLPADGQVAGGKKPLEKKKSVRFGEEEEEWV